MAALIAEATANLITAFPRVEIPSGHGAPAVLLEAAKPQTSYGVGFGPLPQEMPPGHPLIFSKAGKRGKNGVGSVISASMPDSIDVSKSVEGRALYEGLDAWLSQVLESYNEGNGAKMGRRVRSLGIEGKG